MRDAALGVSVTTCVTVAVAVAVLVTVGVGTIVVTVLATSSALLVATIAADHPTVSTMAAGEVTYVEMYLGTMSSGHRGIRSCRGTG